MCHVKEKTPTLTLKFFSCVKVLNIELSLLMKRYIMEMESPLM